MPIPTEQGQPVKMLQFKTHRPATSVRSAVAEKRESALSPLATRSFNGAKFQSLHRFQTNALRAECRVWSIAAPVLRLGKCVGLLAVIILALGSTVVRGFAQSPLYGWDVSGVASGTTTLNAATAASNISGGQLSLTGITASTAQNTFGGSNWNLTNTFDETNKYFSFNVTPSSGYQVTYSSIQWDQEASASTPNWSRWGYKIGSGAFTLQDPFSTPNTISSDVTWDFTDFTASDSVEFRFWTYGSTRTAGGSSSLAGGTSRIRNLAGNDLILYGSVAAIVQVGSSMFWTANGASLGGAGTWNATNANWSANESPVSGATWDTAKKAIFQGTAGTVTVGSVNVSEGLLFGATGYTLNSGTITLSGTASVNNTITTQPSATATIASTLTGSNGLTKSGDGTLVLSGSNSYTGGTTISTGTLQLGAGSTVGSISGTISNQGVLVVNRSDNLTLSESISGAGSLVKNGSGALILSGSNSYSGGTTISSGTLQAGHNSALGTGSITLGVSGTTASITFTSADATDRTISNSLASFAGSNWNTAFGSAVTGNLTFGNSTSVTLGSTRTFIVNNSWTSFANSFTGNGDGITKNGTGTLILLGANTYTGATTINAGTLQLGNGGATGSLSTSSAITVNGTLTFNRSGDIAQGTNFSTAAITGTGSLIQNGSGNLTLNAANTYSGGTTLNSGTLNINNASTLGSGTLTINGGTLNNTSGSAITLSTNNAQSWNGDFAFTGAGDLNLGTGNVAMNATRTVTVNGGNLTVGGSISGSGGLTKNGTGTLVLSGSNTYNGTTTINAGTVRAAAANALVNTGNITLNPGGSLLVTADDAIGTNTGIELNGGTLAFGAAGYNGHVGALTLSANSTIDLGTSSNGVLIKFNSINWNNPNALLSIYNWTGNTQYSGNLGGGLDQVVFGNATTPVLSTSQLQQINFYSGTTESSFIANAFQITSGTYNREIIAVPEPETYITGVILLLGFSIYQLRLARQGRGLLHRFTFLRSRGESHSIQ
jgi:autotransporter-associated beta strand protein